MNGWFRHSLRLVLRIARCAIVGMLALLGLAMAVSWVRSYWVPELISLGLPEYRVGNVTVLSARSYGLASHAGSMKLSVFATDAANRRSFYRWKPRSLHPQRIFSWHAQAERRSWGDFALAWNFEKGIFQVIAPYWAWTALAWLWPGVSIVRWWRRRGRLRACRQAGLCVTCSYDLRAQNPGQRCPECGTIIEPGVAHVLRPGPEPAIPLRRRWLAWGALALLLVGYGAYLATKPPAVRLYGRLADQNGLALGKDAKAEVFYSVRAAPRVGIDEQRWLTGRVSAGQDGAFTISARSGIGLRIDNVRLSLANGKQLDFPYDWELTRKTSSRGRELTPAYFNFDPRSSDAHKAWEKDPVLWRLWIPRDPPSLLGAIEWKHPLSIDAYYMPTGDWIAQCDLRSGGAADGPEGLPDDWAAGQRLRVSLLVRIRKIDRQRIGITIECPEGGIIECPPQNYDGVAPDTGYRPQASCELANRFEARDARGPLWLPDGRLQKLRPALYHTFYLRLNQPQGLSPLFAELRIPIHCLNSGTMLLLVVNPTGSRNLEPGGPMKLLQPADASWWSLVRLPDAPPATSPCTTAPKR